MTSPAGRQRAVLITGCSSGIGLCVAQGLRARGYQVFASARQATDVQRLQELGFDSLQLDLTCSASISSAVTAVMEATDGDLYALFNNGAYGQPGAVEDLDRAVLLAQFEANVFGWHELTCQVLPWMRRRGRGRIIQNSSVLGFVALPFRGAYNASKFAIEGLSDTLRLELNGTGIHVCLIEPGPITSRFRANSYAAFMANIRQQGSAFEAEYAGVEHRLAAPDDLGPFTLPAAAVLDKVMHALESPRPRIRYYVTFPTYLFAFLKRVLPDRLLDWVLLRVSRGEMRPR